VYVDRDPVVLSAVRSLQATEPGVAATGGDLTRPHDVLASSVVRAHISTGEPAAVLFCGILHYLPAARAREVVAAFLEPFPEGSAAVISVTRIEDQALLGRLAGGYAAAASWWNHAREDIAGWFGAAGLTVVCGDVGPVGDRWPLPGPPGQRGFMQGGVGLKEAD